LVTYGRGWRFRYKTRAGLLMQWFHNQYFFALFHCSSLLFWTQGISRIMGDKKSQNLFFADHNNFTIHVFYYVELIEVKKDI